MTGILNPQKHPFLLRPNHTILALSVPVLFSLLAEPLTGLIDTGFIARLGVDSQAALGVATTAFSGIFWIFNFLGIGAQTEIAQALGQDQPERASRIITLAVLLSIGFGLALIIVLWPMLGPIARLLGAAGNVETDAVIYGQIRLLGAPAVLATLAAFGALRGKQDMRTPLWIAVLINMLNILLDYPLIFGIGGWSGMGIAGAALASTAAQWIGAVLAVSAIVRAFGWTRAVALRDATRLLQIGGDLFIRTGLLTLFLIIGTRIANLAGADSGAAHQAIRQIFLFAAMGLDALALSAQSLAAYFLGAGWPSQARRVARTAAIWSLGFGVLLAGLLWLSTPFLIAQLVPPAAEPAFRPAWYVVLLIQPIGALSFVSDGLHWGSGDYRFLRNVMILATLTAGSALAMVDVDGSRPLMWVWLITGLWNAVRASFGILRVWPGFGRSPYRTGDTVILTEPAAP